MKKLNDLADFLGEQIEKMEISQHNSKLNNILFNEDIDSPEPIIFHEIKNLEIEGVDAGDYPKFTEAFFSSGEYRGESLTEEELLQLELDYPEKLNIMAFNSLIN